ncbi:MAG: clostripain-related cysteine peptidase [Verrucomicrobiota bacterium]|nr:clostripain-related cysteine peptidase [Verrucomicrobiota bacterium]
MNKKSWTVMVYLAGDNNLDSAGVSDLAEMKKVGSTDKINVLAQFDREAKGSQTRRYYLRKGGVLDSDVVANLGETNTGDPKVLVDFVKWSVKNYPSDRYLLVVWNHGNGWDDSDVYGVARNAVGASITRRGNVVARSADGNGATVSVRRLRTIGGRNFRRALFRTSVEAAVQTRGIAYDDNAQDFLDNLELQRVLLSAKKIIGRNVDLLGLDACLMSMAEVGYENRVAADVTVGSEQIEPGDGWPYNTILADLAKKPQMSARELAATIVKRYIASYAADSEVTQAACDLAQADALAKAVSNLADALRAGLTNGQTRAGILEARTQVQSYETADYVDLQDLCELLEKKCATAQPVAGAAKAVRAVIATYVIASGSKGQSVAHSHGVSIHFPNNPREPLSPLYAKLDFAKDTTWDDFLKAWLAALQQR